MILEVSVPRGMKYCTLYTIGIGKHPCILFCSAQFFDHYDINKSGLFSIHHKALFGIFPLLPPSSANKGNDHACLIGEHWEATNASLMAAEVANRSRAKLEEHREKLRLERSERKVNLLYVLCASCDLICAYFVVLACLLLHFMPWLAEAIDITSCLLPNMALKLVQQDHQKLDRRGDLQSK
eukprot:scaffold192991_cov17-Tisochrysis_lutea.AAC.1